MNKISGWIKGIFKYFRETRVELKKVTWPDRRYVGMATVIILIIVVLLACLVMFIDFGLSRIIFYLNKIV